MLSSLGDGHTDPYSLTQALAVGARMYGAQIYLSCPATSLQQAEDGSWDVGTPHGNIRAKKIINAGGMYIALNVFSFVNFVVEKGEFMNKYRI